MITHFATRGFASIYYISNSGNDSNSGLTTLLPWASLAKVNSSAFKPGDQILFQRGSTFYGSLTVKNSGAAGNPITFGAYGTGDNPVITGFTTVNSWISLGNNIWESTNAVSTLPTCNMVAVNGVNTAMGRYPNANAANSGYLTYQSNTVTSIKSSGLSGTPDWTGAELVVRKNYYFHNRVAITSQSAGTLNYATSISGLSNGYGFFIQDDPRTLDQQNEWYYNSTTKKIKIYSTTQPTNVRVSSVEHPIWFSNTNSPTSYINIENLDVTGSNSEAIYRWAFGLGSQRAHDITISNCNVSFGGISGISIRAIKLTISNCNVSNINGTAINTNYCEQLSVANNSINNIGLLIGMIQTGVAYYSGATSGISASNSPNSTIQYNRITNVGYDGINAGSSGTYNTNISYNYINNYCLVTGDGGGIYWNLGASITATHNIILNGIAPIEGTNQSFRQAVGIYLDHSADSSEVAYNTVYNASVYGIQMNSSNYINLHGNTVYASGRNELMVHRWSPSPKAVGNTISNNYLVSNSLTIKIAAYISWENDASSQAVSNNNYYCRPLSESATISVNQPSTLGYVYYDLIQWQTFSGKDVNSRTSPKTITDANDLQFYFNDTKEPKTINIDQPMMDVKGIKYYGKLTLQPFTSVVLIKDSKSPLTTTEYKTICEGTNYNGWTASGKYERKEISASGDYALVTTFLTATPVKKVTENITINEGAEYQGWKLAGTYTRKLSSVAGCDSIVTTTLQVVLNSTKQADIESTQSIKLVKGYNLISTYVVAPNPDASDVTKSLSNQNLLVKLQDEAGNSLENWGSYGGWINQLGDLENTEGYKIQVTDDCTLQVTGRQVSLPLDISLKKGWNIISFPCIDIVNAMNMVQPLIDQNLLLKVQDESGNSIENWGMFGGWKNGIGNFIPGKAYKVQMQADAILTIQENYPKSAVILAQTEKAEYFTTRIEGNGTDHMNINIAGLSNAGIAVGDELAAFDGNICVGSIKITDGILSSSLASIIASYSTDEKNQNGFKADNPIQIYVWKKLSGEKFKVNVEVIKGQLNFEKNASVFIKMKSLSTVVTNLGRTTKIDVFPNPSNGLFTVRFSELHDKESIIDILDISGRKVASRLVTQLSEVFNLEEQAPGLYLLKTTIGSKEEVLKIIIN